MIRIANVKVNWLVRIMIIMYFACLSLHLYFLYVNKYMDTPLMYQILLFSDQSIVLYSLHVYI